MKSSISNAAAPAKDGLVALRGGSNFWAGADHIPGVGAFDLAGSQKFSVFGTLSKKNLIKH
jgi:hypothetical protein